MMIEVIALDLQTRHIDEVHVKSTTGTYNYAAPISICLKWD